MRVKTNDHDHVSPVQILTDTLDAMSLLASVSFLPLRFNTAFLKSTVDEADACLRTVAAPTSWWIGNGQRLSAEVTPAVPPELVPQQS